MNCVFHKAEVVDAKGELHLTKIYKQFERLGVEVSDIAYNMGKKCVRAQGDTQCERAFWYNKCWKSTDPKVENNCKGCIKCKLKYSSLFSSALLPVVNCHTN